MKLKQLLTMLALSASPAGANPEPAPCADCEVDGETLGRALTELSPLEAMHVATSWAISPDRNKRLAIARALAHAKPVGARTALAHLAADADAEVRAAARASMV